MKKHTFNSPKIWQIRPRAEKQEKIGRYNSQQKEVIILAWEIDRLSIYLPEFTT